MVNIEVGKFYRTVEGDKVGPMYADKFATGSFAARDSGHLWKSDGSRYFGDDDAVLVSEWSDALTIQAGRHYKTRDGRKVGPMIDDDCGDIYPWTTEGGGGYYSDSGVRQATYARETGSLVAEWEEPAAVAVATAAFKAGDRVRRPGHLTGTILGFVGDNVRIDYGTGWGEYFFTVPELELVEAYAATPKVGDWVRTEHGDIGIVFHDDGDAFANFKVGIIESGEWIYQDVSDLTTVSPGTTKAANDNAPIQAEIDELEQRLTDLRAKLAA
ncbi:hypothetical protein [Bosea sp. LjRoot237]|uniref:hypothetical protein n=1 Tax=Bosea sp. LjRoot237 TaxID=3342292 RepID=UPI003ECC33D8